MSEYEQKAQAFLDSHGLRLRATFKGDRCPEWGGQAPKSPSSCPQCGATHGDRYRVTISRQGGGRVSFDFWGSLSDMLAGKAPTAYDMLACIGSDVYCPEDFEEFCEQYGYDQDSRHAEATFKRCDRFARRLRAFFSEEEREELAEIA